MIHPTAIIDPGARLGQNVSVGPYSVIEADCCIGDNVWIDTHVKIARYTSIGSGSRIYKGALVGEEPQDHRFKVGVVSRTEIGANATLREYVTIHRSPFEGGITSVGEGTLLMAFCHVGHDARIGNYVTAANHTAFSGHVIVEDRAVLSGYVLIHQFCRIGKLASLLSVCWRKMKLSAAPMWWDCGGQGTTATDVLPSKMPSAVIFSEG